MNDGNKINISILDSDNREYTKFKKVTYDYKYGFLSTKKFKKKAWKSK